MHSIANGGQQTMLWMGLFEGLVCLESIFSIPTMLLSIIMSRWEWYSSEVEVFSLCLIAKSVPLFA